MLCEQLGATQKETTQKLGVIAQELMQHFEGETSRVQLEVVVMEKNEI